MQKYLTLGTKIDECDIAITDDTIISQPLETVKQYLTEEAWLKLSQEGIYILLERLHEYCYYTHLLQLPQ